MQHMSWLRDFQSIATLGRLSFRLLILAWAAGCFGNGCPLPYSRDGLRGLGNSVWGTSPWVSPQPMGRGRGAFLRRTVCLSLLIDTFHSETSIDAGEASAGGTPGSAFLCGIFRDRQF